MAFPSVLAFSNIDKTPVRYLANNVDAYSPITFSGETVFSPFARFMVEPVQDGLVQIRSCYHNRLWARKAQSENTIVTRSDSVKDKSNWQCTLFKPTVAGSNVSFSHVQSGKNLVITGDDFHNVAIDNNSSGNEVLMAKIINLDTLVKLPKYVQFKCETGKFLRAAMLTYNLPPAMTWKPTEELREGGRYEFLKFSETDSTAKATMFEVLDDIGTGSAGFKYAINGKIWGAPYIRQKWVLITYDVNNVTNPRCQFEPVKTEEIDVIAFKNIFHKAYVKRLTTFEYTDSLSAMGETIDYSSKFWVVEPIKNRTVIVTKFRYEAFRIISDEKEAVIDSKEFVNTGTSELTKTDKFTLYDEYRTGKWTKTISIQTKAGFFFKSPFPVYKEGEFSDRTGEASEKDYEWGKILERTNNMVEENYSVKVPARSVRTANLVARKIVYEIPFNFNQNDVNSINGESVMLDDQYEGLFVGVIQSDYKIKIF